MDLADDDLLLPGLPSPDVAKLATQLKGSSPYAYPIARNWSFPDQVPPYFRLAVTEPPRPPFLGVSI